MQCVSQLKLERGGMETYEQGAVLQRLMKAAGVKNESGLATVLGISHQAVYNAKKKGSIPSAWVLTIARKYGVTTDWLHFGDRKQAGTVEEPSADSNSAAPASFPSAIVQPVGPLKEIPVRALASCGLKGWYRKGTVALSCPVPVGGDSEKLFAVLAVGTSMQPAGISEGYVVICDPDKSLDPGDAVFIERHDGTVGIKLYQGEDDEWYHLKGWLEPKDDGSQKPFVERLRKSAVARMTTITIVKRK